MAEPDQPAALPVIRYLNTDLELVSAADLAPLATLLGERKWSILHCGQWEDGLWRAAFETWADLSSPERTIASMLDTVETLPEPLAALWRGASSRDFNIGFDGGQQPRMFSETLGSDLLRRIAALGATVTVTIYAPAPSGEADLPRRIRK